MLADDQIRAFFAQGFLIIRDVFTEEEISQLAAACDRLQEDAQNLRGKTMHKGSQFVIGEHGEIKRVAWAGAAEPYLLQIGRDARITHPVSQLLDSEEADHLINQVHFKLPGDNVSFPWHQDSTHRRYGTDMWTDVNGKGSFVQVALAIDASTEENGPLLFIPGNPGRHLDLTYDERTYSEEFNPDDAVPALLQPGDIALFGPYVIHGSKPNTSDKPRRVLINGFAYPGANAREYPGDGSGERISLKGLK